MCQCRPHAELSSDVHLVCGRCGRRLLSSDDARQLDDLNRNATAGDAAKLPDGRIHEALALDNNAEASSDPPPGGSLFTRRGLAKGMRDIAIAALAGATSHWLILRLGGFAASDKELEAIRHELTNAQVHTVEAALGRGENLRTLAATFLSQDHNGAHNFAQAVADHTDGSHVGRAIAGFRTLLADSRLCPETQDAVRFRLAKALGLAGMVDAGSRELTALLSSREHPPITRVKYLRQAMNHSYLLLRDFELARPELWTVIQSCLHEAKEIMALSCPLSSEPTRCLSTASRFHPGLGPAVLMFEALSDAALSESDRGATLHALKVHLDLVRALVGIDEVTGWNRYTPLAAQAMYLDQLDFASTVLDEAKDLSFRLGNARRQRQQEGAEWLLHLAQRGVLALKQGKAQEARKALRYLMDGQRANKLRPFLRPLTGLKQRAERAMCEAVDVDARAGAVNVPYDSHAAFFPRWAGQYWN